MTGVKEAPLHLGHRDRLRARFQLAGADALADYELLELLLFGVIPRQDTKQIAKRILAAFGGLEAALAAPLDKLTQVQGVGEKVALHLKAVHAILLRASLAEARGRTDVGSWSALLRYLRLALAHEAREQFRVLFLDKKNQIIADEVQSYGTVDQAHVYPREVVRRALELSASGLVLVHNHPSGDPTPSRADIAVTREIMAAAETMRLTVIDHIIIGADDTKSFKALGLL